MPKTAWVPIKPKDLSGKKRRALGEERTPSLHRAAAQASVIRENTYKYL
jgi:hypothetical protein